MSQPVTQSEYTGVGIHASQRYALKSWFCTKMTLRGAVGILPVREPLALGHQRRRERFLLRELGHTARGSVCSASVGAGGMLSAASQFSNDRRCGSCASR